MKKTIFTIFVIALVMIGVMFADSVKAGDTGWQSPTTTGIDWNEGINPQNAYLSNDTYVDFLSTSFTRQDYGGFDFSSIPGDATITGIEVAVEGYEVVFELGPYQNVAIWTTTFGESNANYNLNFSSSDTIEIVGSDTDLWQYTSFLLSDVLDGQFKVILNCYGMDIGDESHIDHIQAKVYYTSADVYGCTDPEANNYDPEATIDDGSCTYDVYGCTDPEAINYNSEATIDDGSCEYLGGLVSISAGAGISNALGVAGDLFGDLSSFVYMFMGIPFGIGVVRKTIGLFRR